MGRKIPTNKIMISTLVFLLLLIPLVSAHCPLCTAGAIGAAGVAAWLGVKASVVGIFIGAFAASIGWWFSNIIKKRYIPYQSIVIVVLSFITTVGPISKMFKEVGSYYINLFGGYGSLFNRTYVYSPFLVGAIVGTVIVSVSPYLSKKITLIAGNKKPKHYQGMILMGTLLILASLVFYVI